MSTPPCLALVGPTASGKTGLSLLLAGVLDCEIVSVDSRQVYRGMDVGTAKPSLQDRARVPHHGLDVVDPDERFSAGRFARLARAWIRDIQGRGRTPLLVGGTGFFLRTLLEPMFREPPLDPERRRALEPVLAALDPGESRRWLEALDPARAGVAAEGGPQRIQRTLEVALLTGRPLSWWHHSTGPEGDPVPMRIVALDADPAWLRPRIDARVDAMLAGGLVDEVEALLEAGFDETSPGMTGTGYREVAAHLRGGGGDLAPVAEAIRVATRQYARRQRTWFRHQLPADALRLDAALGPEVLARRVVDFWKGRGG